MNARLRACGVIRVVVRLIDSGSWRGRGGRELWRRILSFIFLEGALQFLFNPGGGFLELANRFAQPARELRQFLPAKEHENDDKYQHHLRTTQSVDESERCANHVHCHNVTHLAEKGSSKFLTAQRN